MTPFVVRKAATLNRRQVGAFLASGLASGAVFAQSADAPQAQADAAPMADMQATLSARLKAEGVGFVSAQWHAGSSPRYASAGLRHVLQEGTPTERTRFEYGSISKTFVALLLADAVHRRELALDDPAESLLPDGLKLRDSGGQPIRIVDLATHRSGLPRLPSNMAPKVPADPYADYTEAMLWAFIQQWKPEVARQARWEYSNLGYGLLGQLLARRMQRPFALAMEERVLGPLQLKSASSQMFGIAADAALSAAKAQGHDEQRRPVPAWNFQALAGAGALVGDAQDLIRYAQVALDSADHPLAPAFALCMKRHAEGPAAGQGQGLGWLLASVRGRTLVNHDGGTHGFSASLFLDPERRRAALVLANAFVVVNDLALHALDNSFPLRDVAKERRDREASANRESIRLEAQAIAPLAGVYALNPQFKLTVSAQGDKLFAQATGQGAFELFASGRRSFFARVAPIEIEFEGGEGPAPSLLLRQAGQRLRFVRE